jgi:hypothetical protein
VTLAGPHLGLCGTLSIAVVVCAMQCGGSNRRDAHFGSACARTASVRARQHFARYSGVENSARTVPAVKIKLEVCIFRRTREAGSGKHPLYRTRCNGTDRKDGSQWIWLEYSQIPPRQNLATQSHEQSGDGSGGDGRLARPCGRGRPHPHQSLIMLILRPTGCTCKAPGRRVKVRRPATVNL